MFISFIFIYIPSTIIVGYPTINTYKGKLLKI